MKPSILLVIVICFLAACQQKPESFGSAKSIYRELTAQNRKDFILTIDEKGISPIRDFDEYDFRGSYIMVPAILENRSNDTLCYINWSCSDREIFRVNNIRLSVDGVKACQANFETVYKIAPKQSGKFDIRLDVSGRKIGAKIFKIGIILQIYCDGDYFDSEIIGDSTTKANIWSNEVHLPQ